jgi:hypothetical protein
MQISVHFTIKMVAISQQFSVHTLISLVFAWNYCLDDVIMSNVALMIIFICVCMFFSPSLVMVAFYVRTYHTRACTFCGWSQLEGVRLHAFTIAEL